MRLGGYMGQRRSLEGAQHCRVYVFLGVRVLRGRQIKTHIEEERRDERSGRNQKRPLTALNDVPPREPARRISGCACDAGPGLPDF